MSGVFLYGTLRHLPLLRIVVGPEADAGVKARLPGHAVYRVKDQDFPMIAEAPGAVAEGLFLPDISDAAKARMDFYEAGFDFDRRPVEVETAQGSRSATVFFPASGHWQAGPAWSLADWARSWGRVAERAADEIMERFGQDDAAAIARFRPQIWQRAASQVRAQADRPAIGVRIGFRDTDVKTTSTTRPYNKYFMLEERQVQFRLFKGGFSEPVARAAFASGDAVTVLPYDPVRDRVLLIEQFRFGAYVRGDTAPWSLEPIAGRIDAGEAPEDSARRESMEESRLALISLEPVARYYPSPGAVSEYLFSYIGIADLPDSAGGVGGLDSESEDIRSVVLPFDELMGLLDSGEAENGPLILSALWLAANRDRLRRDA